MTEKISVAVLYGGKSTEHEVSVHSAQTVCRLLRQSGKYDVLPVFINKQGFWFLQTQCGFAAPVDRPVTPVISPEGSLFLPQENVFLRPQVYFPVLHGSNGEDGTIQGLLETLDAAYVGCGVLASAWAMDKEAAKAAAREEGVPVLPYQKISRGAAYDKAALEAWAAQTGYPVFVKPVRLGSSVGVTKVLSAETLHQAVAFALRFDTDALVEKGVEKPREVFCGLLGEGENLRSSLCGELKNPSGGFFDYQAKYITQGGCETSVPADLLPQTQQEIRRCSERIFNALRGSGLARADFLVGQDGKVWFSEINTIPGLSETSLYPQLFEASGVPYPQVLDELISLALQVHRRRATLAMERAG